MASRSTDYQNSEIILQMHVTASNDRQAGTQKKQSFKINPQKKVVNNMNEKSI